MINIQDLVSKTLEKNISVWVPFEEVDTVSGFEVEIAFVGREQMQKLYESCTQKKYNRKSHRLEEETNKNKLQKLWAERVIKDWKGLTLGKLSKLVPITLSKEDKPDIVVEATEENIVALLKHNAEFDDFVLNVATDSEVFSSFLKEQKVEVENLKK